MVTRPCSSRLAGSGGGRCHCLELCWQWRVHSPQGMKSSSSGFMTVSLLRSWAYLSPFQTFLILQRCDPCYRLRCIQRVGVTPADYLIVEQGRIDFPRATIELGH